jgi:hypothetical protein
MMKLIILALAFGAVMLSLKNLTALRGKRGSAAWDVRLTLIAVVFAGLALIIPTLTMESIGSSTAVLIKVGCAGTAVVLLLASERFRKS